MSFQAWGYGNDTIQTGKRSKMEHPYRTEHFYDKIPGYFDFADFYVNVVKHFESGSHFVEVGSYRGSSLAHLIVEIINSGKEIKVTSVDLFGLNWRQCNTYPRLYSDFLKYTVSISKHFDVLRMESAEAAATFPDESLDFVYIDTTHLYKECFADVDGYIPKMKPGGVIAGHDYSWGGVEQAVRELLGDAVDHYGETWWYQFPGEGEKFEPVFPEPEHSPLDEGRRRGESWAEYNERMEEEQDV